MKRLFDLVFSFLGLVILSPFFIITSVLLLIFQGWPVFFVQTRVGLKGRTFRLSKFRTMKNENKGQPLIVFCGAANNGWFAENDTQISSYLDTVEKSKANGRYLNIRGQNQRQSRS